MQVYNTLGRRLEPFEPRRSGEVSMYVCGPTVQSAPHLGHGRQAVAFDVMRRYFAWRGFEVTYVSNVTDIDDKIIARAQAEGLTTLEVAEKASTEFMDAYGKLGVMVPDIQPRATEHITEMIEMIQTLIDKEHAYAAGGDVYFAVRSFPDYGKLSGHDIDDLLSGARVEMGDKKRDPLDFALWKAAKPGEPHWTSPWGEGRPGWHIECSAMSYRHLGFGFDIHGGGLDLVFPHHENEIAQSEAAAGDSPFARYWLHNGMVNLSGEKMAKSTGNIVGLAEALETYPPLAIRLFYLRTHYRKPLDFTAEAIEDAGASLDRLWQFRRRTEGAPGRAPDEAAISRFTGLMDEDFDVAGGLGVLFEVVRDGNKLLDSGESADHLVATYDELMSVLGIAEPHDDLEDLAPALEELAAEHAVTGSGVAALVEGLLVRRREARDQKDWATSDVIRDALNGLGLVLEDTDDGVRWYRP